MDGRAFKIVLATETEMLLLIQMIAQSELQIPLLSGREDVTC